MDICPEGYPFGVTTRKTQVARLNIRSLLTVLGDSRNVFHSEADFQHALAWHIHQKMPEIQIRLERMRNELGLCKAGHAAPLTDAPSYWNPSPPGKRAWGLPCQFGNHEGSRGPAAIDRLLPTSLATQFRHH